MKINMFEGARRITKLIAVIWVVGWCFYLSTFNPYIHAYFRVDSPGSVPIRMGEQENPCEDEDARESFYSKFTNKGTLVSGTLCFSPIVYEKYSTNVSNYTNEVLSDFKFTKADEEWIDEQVWPERWKEIKEGSFLIIGGVAFLYIFSWCVGWIIRGFAGIPLGQDRKPDDIQTPKS